jgi:hypothetical protein
MDAVRQGEQMVPEAVRETVEQYTPNLSASTYFGIALGAMALMLWALMGVYTHVTDYRASSPAERLRRGDFQPRRGG